MIFTATGLADYVTDEDLRQRIWPIIALPTSRQTLYARQQIMRRKFPVIVWELGLRDESRPTVADWIMERAAALERLGVILEME